MENYVVLDLIGEGSFGKVRPCSSVAPMSEIDNPC
jgi:hypothetical protein